MQPHDHAGLPGLSTGVAPGVPRDHDDSETVTDVGRREVVAAE